MSNNLESYLQYWKQIFSSANPVKALGINEFEKEMNLFNFDIAPEPYYGYFHDDMKNDVLLLLFNPGAKNKSTSEEGWNLSVKERYTQPWTKEKFNEVELKINLVSDWRHTYLKRANNIVGPSGFLHSMEFFPFHSPNDHTSKKFKEKWMNHVSTDLALHALKDIAVNHKVKQILTVNEIWPLLLEKYNVPLTHHVELFKQGGKAYSFRFKVYQFTQDALPILYCKSNGNMQLLTNKFAVEVARSLIGLSTNSIPLNTEYEIKVIK
ncbi:TPA: hypothetical protein NJY08_004847 [Salmonella enterica subsp. enterica serovar Typhi str. AG3]|nr:hypothetical protein [Salmonella enterica subsp. enterica serovar Typhi str. AG3]